MPDNTIELDENVYESDGVETVSIETNLSIEKTKSQGYTHGRLKKWRKVSFDI